MSNTIKPHWKDFGGNRKAYNRAYRAWQKKERLCQGCGNPIAAGSRGSRCMECQKQIRRVRGTPSCLCAARSLQLRVFHLNHTEFKWRSAEKSVLIESQQFSVVISRLMADLRLMQITVADRSGIDRGRFNQCLHGKLAFRPEEALRIAKTLAQQDAIMSRPVGHRVFLKRTRRTVSPSNHTEASPAP